MTAGSAYETRKSPGPGLEEGSHMFPAQTLETTFGRTNMKNHTSAAEREGLYSMGKGTFFSYLWRGTSLPALETSDVA